MSLLSSGHIFLANSILFGVASNLIFRSQVGYFPILPKDYLGKLITLSLYLFSSPLLLLGIFFVFIGGINWLLALTKFELSQAFPITGLSYALILFADVVFFNASLTVEKIIGTSLIFLGIYLLIRS